MYPSACTIYLEFHNGNHYNSLLPDTDNLIHIDLKGEQVEKKVYKSYGAYKEHIKIETENQKKLIFPKLLPSLLIFLNYRQI